MQMKHGKINLIPSDYKTSALFMGQGINRDNLINNSIVLVDDKLKVTCDDGYEVSGERIIHCLSTTLLSSSLAACKKSYCDKLHNIINGYIVTDSTYRGAVVTYACNVGYKLVGTPTRKCRRNKTWSHSTPKCRIIQCNKPHNVAHGEVDFNKNQLNFGSTIQYSCHIGYEIVGANSRVCGASGEWEGAEPECVRIRCPVPRIPLHGEQDIGSLVVGGRVIYQCNHGYKLIGNSVLTCLGNKTWSSMVPKCEKIYCEKPISINNGVALVTNVDFDSKVEYRCDTGYSLIGPHVLTCLHTGQWSGAAPSCTARLCPNIEVNKGNVKQEGRVPGDVAAVSCDIGHVLHGSARLVCQITLDWTPGPLPTCEPINCGNLPETEFAISQTNGFSYQDTANYTCLPGYEMRVRIGITFQAC